MSRRHSDRRVFRLGRIEKKVLRIIVVGFILLSLFQLKSLTDPVDFYLKVAGDFDTPAFKYSDYEERKIDLYFQSQPEGPVLVKQNDRILGVIGPGLEVEVEPGIVFLDATAVDYPLVVDIFYNEKSQRIKLHGEEKSFEVRIKSKDSL
ncbi:MAG: hypothetical protein ACOX7U_00975 [Desulfitobacteriia bacterium]|jgi:hypothetical protein